MAKGAKMPDNPTPDTETPKTSENNSQKPPITVNEYIGDIQGNILDTVDLPTYHLKLYMIGPGSKNTNAGGETNPEQNQEITDGDQQREDQAKKGTLQTTGSGYLNNRVDADPNQTVVLAETGVTEVGIDGLEIATIPGGNGSQTSTVNFTITQPNAADFPDQIVKARTYLGAPPDAMDVPLFLEVSFRGRKESDENLENWNTDKGGEIIKNVAGPFVYNLILKNFDMEITQAGSTYNFETVVRDNLFTADSFFRTKRFMTISGRTIGQMLKSLEDQTNDYNVEQGIPDRISFGLSSMGERTDSNTYTVTRKGKTSAAQTSTSTTDDYFVEGLKHISDQNLDVEDTETLNQVINPPVDEAEGQDEAKEESETPRESKNTVSKDPKSNLISIDLKEGIAMDKILGILLSMNLEFMQKASRTADIQDPANEEVDATKQPIWYKYEGSIEYGEYMPKEKRYFKTAFLIPTTYESPKTDIAIFPWEVDKNNDLSEDETVTRINQMKIKKAYEYIFTGRNDQILGCNIQYKEGIALLLPTDRGLLGDISLNAASILNSTPVPKNQQIDDKGLEKLTEAAENGNMNFIGALKKIKQDIKKGEAFLQQVGSAANFSEEQIKDLIQNTNGQAAKKLQEALKDQSTAQGIANVVSAQRPAQANVVTQSEEFSPSESGFIYGGDLVGQNQYSQELFDKGKQFRTDQNTTPDPTSTGAAAVGQRIAEEKKNKEFKTLTAQRKQFLHKEGFANVGTTKGIKNNLFSYLYDQHVAIDFLMRLDLNLRGDPWWLGKPVHEFGKVPIVPGMDAEKLEETDEDGANYLTTTKDNFLLFSLNSPRLFDPDVENEDNNTGLWIKEGDGTSYFISGIYLVKTVTHSFNNGVYTMDVESVKETAISLQNADRLKTQFSYVDEDRKGFTSLTQDGVVSESDRDKPGYAYEKPHHEFVRGAMTSSKKTPEELKEDGTITQEQYDAYKSWLRNEKKKEQERRDSLNNG